MIGAPPLPRRPFGARARDWAERSLFASRGGTVLTLVSAIVLGLLAFVLARFVFVSADWQVIEANRRLLAIGRYPAGEEWRLWPPLWALFAFGGLTFGLWIRVGLRGGVIAAGALAFAYAFLFEGAPALLFALGVALALGGYVLAQYVMRGRRIEGLARVVAVVGLALLVPFTVVVLQVGDGVRTSLWGGFMLNVMLAAVGIGLGFPLGVALALGRASSYPAIRLVCTSYIEVVRAGPLVAWLFIARFVLPTFLPPVLSLDQLDIVARAMLVLAGFTGAYVAEVVRGGLQSLPRGQIEAAQALGLGSIQTTTLIVMPQALRAVIPPLVSQFISLWKDTTLVFVLGLTELLGAGEATLSQSAFVGDETEVFAFVGFAFWSVAFAMSRLALRIERSLGVGVR